LHGAFLCYREQCLPLLRGEITNKSNIELNTVNQSSRLSVAVSAIFGMAHQPEVRVVQWRCSPGSPVRRYQRILWLSCVLSRQLVDHLNRNAVAVTFPAENRVLIDVVSDHDRCQQADAKPERLPMPGSQNCFNDQNRR
jgi:hypothetical protein